MSLSKVRAMATLPRAVPSASKVRDTAPILAETGAAAVNSLWVGSSQDAMVPEETELFLWSMRPAALVGGGVRAKGDLERV